jgi:hypothetical protein
MKLHELYIFLVSSAVLRRQQRQRQRQRKQEEKNGKETDA